MARPGTHGTCAASPSGQPTWRSRCASSSAERPSRMRVLLIGVGTVGEAIARMAATRDWCEGLVLADYDVARARSLEAELMESGKAHIVVERTDARDPAAVADL